MVVLQVPCTVQDLTPEWFTAALRHARVLRTGRVSRVECARIGMDSGLTSEAVRVQLTYTVADAGAPEQLIAKLASSSAEVRNRAAHVLHAYEREVRFYQELATDVPIRTPHCLYAAIEPEAGWFVLLLEDLGAAREGNDLAGCTEADAAAALRALARLHATFWDNPQLQELPWLFSPEWHAMRLVTVAPVAFPAFAERMGPRLPAGLLAVLREIPDALERGQLISRSPRTLTHGDYSSKNMFFTDTSAGTEVTVFDWQTVGHSPGAFDVSQFINRSLPVARLRAEATALLQLYHEYLIEYGVRDFPFSHLLHDYRCGTLRWALVPVVMAGGAAEPSPNRIATAERSLERIQAVLEEFDPIAFMASAV